MKRRRANPVGRDGRWAPGIEVIPLPVGGYSLRLERDPAHRVTLTVLPGARDARGRETKRGAHRNLDLLAWSSDTNVTPTVFTREGKIEGRWNTRTGKVSWFVRGPAAGRSLQVLVGRLFYEKHGADIDALLDLLMRDPKLGETYTLPRENPTRRANSTRITNLPRATDANAQTRAPPILLRAIARWFGVSVAQAFDLAYGDRTAMARILDHISTYDFERGRSLYLIRDRRPLMTLRAALYATDALYKYFNTAARSGYTRAAIAAARLALRTRNVTVADERQIDAILGRRPR